MKNLEQISNEEFKNNIIEKIMYEIEQNSNSENFYSNILKNADENLDFLKFYNLPISETEKTMAKFWFSKPPALLDRLAKHIVNAFFHGFISQSREVKNRKRVRLVCAVGQEALVKMVVNEFKKYDFEVILLKPSTIETSSELDELENPLEYFKIKTEAYKLATEKFSNQISQICGFVRIGTFGGNAIISDKTKTPNAEKMQAFQAMQREIRKIETSILKPDTLSFCSVAFPDVRVGEYRFEEVFDEFCKLNTTKSEPIELVQAELIDLLDTCTKVKLLGRNGNETNLTVSLKKLENPEKETLFLNCGGDLNIPHGEMFTTPKLSGTNGVLHVKEIFLKQDFYKNLRLEFKDGIVVNYSCENFEDEAQNRNYVFEKLLNRNEKVPMGELSIGTNTEAYKVAKKYDLFSILPILIAEKMGPHIAIGDPCFARGEDSPVYNIHGGREMIARENELTARRNEVDCYVNLHTDITIPFDDMALFAGIKSNGEEVEIIKNGRFVPECAKILNQALETN